MDVGAAISRARLRAELSQAELAARAHTSQPAVSAYEAGVKTPSVSTLQRLLDACGMQLTATPARRTPAELATSAARLHEVLELAGSLPFRRAAALDYPRLPS